MTWISQALTVVALRAPVALLHGRDTSQNTVRDTVAATAGYES